MTKPKQTPTTRPKLPKSPTGIQGLDEILDGGLPTGRPTLICGGPGCGKTLLAMEFVVRGATLYDEPGVFMAFEEAARDLSQNVASIGFDLDELIRRKKLVLDIVRIDHRDIEESGAFDLEGLFIRLGHAIDSIGAKRVVLDTIESLFSDLPNPMILREELHRLFRWLKERGVTTVITGERGKETLTRQGLEEYVSDCVISLDHRVEDQICSRRLRVVKLRGSTHGTNEYPFLIDEDGISIFPITSLGLSQLVSNERVSTGIGRLDTMLGGSGYYRGSSVLISGVAGTGKSSIVAHFADAACRRGERVIFFSFEESPSQIVRNMSSIGIDLETWEKKGLLLFHASRPSSAGLEIHLSRMIKEIHRFRPQVVIADPLTSFSSIGDRIDVKSTMTRLMDFLKISQITGLFTSLISGLDSTAHTDVGISSLIDTWILLKDIESASERNRSLVILKSRGMQHSNQVREFLLTDHGGELRDLYVGPGGVLAGAARLTLEAQEKAALVVAAQEAELRRVELERKRSTMEAHIAVLKAEFAVQEIAAERLLAQEKIAAHRLASDVAAMALMRKADKPHMPKEGGM
jgi:circadian clock protein KaiC